MGLILPTETSRMILQVSNEKRAPGYLLYIGDDILPNYIGMMMIIIIIIIKLTNYIGIPINQPV